MWSFLDATTTLTYSIPSLFPCAAGNVLNFNVGEGVKFALPNVFWTRLSGKYGTVSLHMSYAPTYSGIRFCETAISQLYLFVCNSTQTFYVKENGIDLAITNGVEAIVSCLRSEDGYCVSPPDEGQSLKGLGFR